MDTVSMQFQSLATSEFGHLRCCGRTDSNYLEANRNRISPIEGSKLSITLIWAKVISRHVFTLKHF